MTWSGKIGALVLTYNRKNVLSRCLDAMRRQLEPPDEILVLDNGSEDGTCDHLRQAGLLDDERILLYRVPENLGPAGGVEILVQLAMDRGCDWLWFTDDDTIPDPDALKELKAAFTANFSRPEEIGFLKSVVVTADGRPNNLPDVDMRAGPGQCASWADRLGAGLVKLRWSPFNSIFIPRSTVLRVGGLSSDFYFAGEDIDFTFRATEHLPGYLVGKSRTTHLCAVSGFFSSLTESDPERIRMGRYFYRNNLYFRWRYYSPGRTALYIGKCLYEAVLALGAKTYRTQRAANILLGLLSGFFFIASRHKSQGNPPKTRRVAPVQITGAPSDRLSAVRAVNMRPPPTPNLADPMPN